MQRVSRRGPKRTRQFSFPLFRQPVRCKENKEMAVTQPGTRDGYVLLALLAVQNLNGYI